MFQKPLKTRQAKPLDGWLIGMIFQARERGLRSQRSGFTHDGLKRGIETQRSRVITVLVACGNLINSLTKHLMGLVLDESPMTPVVEDPVELFGERQLGIKLAQEQKTAVRGDVAAIEIENDFWLKTKRELIKTLCSHRSSVCCERLSPKSTLFLTQFDGVGGFFIRSTMNNPG